MKTTCWRRNDNHQTTDPSAVWRYAVRLYIYCLTFVFLGEEDFFLRIRAICFRRFLMWTRDIFDSVRRSLCDKCAEARNSRECSIFFKFPSVLNGPKNASPRRTRILQICPLILSSIVHSLCPCYWIFDRWVVDAHWRRKSVSSKNAHLTNDESFCIESFALPKLNRSISPMRWNSFNGISIVMRNIQVENENMHILGENDRLLNQWISFVWNVDSIWLITTVHMCDRKLWPCEFMKSTTIPYLGESFEPMER